MDMAGKHGMMMEKSKMGGHGMMDMGMHGMGMGKHMMMGKPKMMYGMGDQGMMGKYGMMYGMGDHGMMDMDKYGMMGKHMMGMDKHMMGMGMGKYGGMMGYCKDMMMGGGGGMMMGETKLQYLNFFNCNTRVLSPRLSPLLSTVHANDALLPGADARPGARAHDDVQGAHDEHEVQEHDDGEKDEDDGHGPRRGDDEAHGELLGKICCF